MTYFLFNLLIFSWTNKKILCLYLIGCLRMVKLWCSFCKRTARVNSHQRWKQTRIRVCFHLWCELTRTMSTIWLRGITALFGIFLETNKHQNLTRLGCPIIEPPNQDPVSPREEGRTTPVTLTPTRNLMHFPFGWPQIAPPNSPLIPPHSWVCSLQPYSGDDVIL